MAILSCVIFEIFSLFQPSFSVHYAKTVWSRKKTEKTRWLKVDLLRNCRKPIYKMKENSLNNSSNQGSSRVQTLSESVLTHRNLILALRWIVKMDRWNNLSQIKSVCTIQIPKTKLNAGLSAVLIEWTCLTKISFFRFGVEILKCAVWQTVLQALAKQEVAFLLHPVLVFDRPKPTVHQYGNGDVYGQQ